MRLQKGKHGTLVGVWFKNMREQNGTVLDSGNVIAHF
jgi:hypothetical protein